MFIVVFVVMLPVYLNSKDPVQAWQAGLAWAFLIGVIVMIGAYVGPYIRKLTPRAAMLGTLAGISITFISMRPAAQMWEAAWIGLPVMSIILIGFFTDVKLPFNIPVGLAALIVGTAIGWIGGFMSAPDVGQAVSDIAIGIPDLRIDLLFHGLSDLAPLLGTAIPLGVYNFTEAMSNVESTRQRVTTTTCAVCCWPTVPGRSSDPPSARLSLPPCTSATRDGRTQGAALDTHWPAA